jgi:hypothetical protein
MKKKPPIEPRDEITEDEFLRIRILLNKARNIGRLTKSESLEFAALVAKVRRPRRDSIAANSL